jgi:menaquinone-dependent protoporphyrinogen oxidase
VRILIAYGSSRGGTAGLAEMVAVALTHHGFEVEVGNAAEISEVSGYDGVIVGGALYNNHWHSDATDFVNRFADVLHRVPVWFFSSGPLDDSASSGAVAPIPQVRDLARKFDIRSHMTFGGVLEKRASGRLSAFLSYGDVGDWRDRAQVAQWADRIVVQAAELRTTIVLPDPDSPLRREVRLVDRADLADPADALDAEKVEEIVEESRLDRIRRLLSSEEVEDDAGLDVLL